MHDKRNQIKYSSLLLWLCCRRHRTSDNMEWVFPIVYSCRLKSFLFRRTTLFFFFYFISLLFAFTSTVQTIYTYIEYRYECIIVYNWRKVRTRKWFGSRKKGWIWRDCVRFVMYETIKAGCSVDSTVFFSLIAELLWLRWLLLMQQFGIAWIVRWKWWNACEGVCVFVCAHVNNDANQ